MRILLLILLPIFCAAQTGKVIGVKDGDTIVILDSNNTQTTIRLAGIDCPEKKQAFGQKAKEFTSNMVFGKQVKCVPATKDRYGRTVAWIFVNGVSLNEALLLNGYAWHYIKYDKQYRLDSLQHIAETGHVGLWTDNSPTQPWEYRHK